jgi:hypothetical protein
MLLLLMMMFYRLVSIAGPLFVEGVAAIGEQLVATAAVGQLPDPTALPALVMAQVTNALFLLDVQKVPESKHCRRVYKALAAVVACGQL